jgi:hypothetical protein
MHPPDIRNQTNPLRRHPDRLPAPRPFPPQTTTHPLSLKSRPPPSRTDTAEDIPDVKTFLERIGRDAAKECEDKIPVCPPPPGKNTYLVVLGSVVQSERQVFEGEGDSRSAETVYLTADGEVSVCPLEGHVNG